MKGLQRAQDKSECLRPQCSEHPAQEVPYPTSHPLGFTIRSKTRLADVAEVTSLLR